MKKRIFFSALIIIFIFGLAYRFSKKAPVTEEAPQKAVQNVTVRSVADSAHIQKTLSYPALVVGDQEVTVTAGSAGTAIVAPFELGSYVRSGSLLLKIDDIGNAADTDYKNFQSSQLQTSHISKEQAEERLKAAKEYYKDLKKAYDEGNPAITKPQVDAAENQIEIAKLDLESAQATLKGLLDNHLIVSPISGYVTQKDIDAGDSISVGQKIATISKTGRVKFHFFVDADNLPNFKPGTKIDIVGQDKKIIGIVKNVSPTADPDTKRFLVEAYPDPAVFLIGTIVTASLEITQKASDKNIFVPLSAITIGQNESHVLIIEDGHAKQVSVQVVSISGENAEIKSDLDPSARIILGGAKLVQNGDAVNVQE